MSPYETDELTNQYLLFHYGDDADLMPFPYGPVDALHFPIRCVSESLKSLMLPSNSIALDIGCAVGRSCYELAKYCAQVVGIDKSQSFIDAAQELQRRGKLEYTLYEEGEKIIPRWATCPNQEAPIEFKHMDIHTLSEATFDVVLAANLLCRLDNPWKFLTSVPDLISPNGIFILATPYSWLEEFTPKFQWLKKDRIFQILNTQFKLIKNFNLTFLIREHYRKYQWGVTELTVWKKI